jgi:hypothetical protein
VTTRLYYSDSWLCRFDAAITEAGTLPDGRAFVARKTAFIPPLVASRTMLAASATRRSDVSTRDAAVLHVLDRAPARVSMSQARSTRRAPRPRPGTAASTLSAAFVHACARPRPATWARMPQPST